MANVKLTELTAYTSPVSTDVLPIVDLVNNQTKKITIEDLLKRFGAGTEALPSFSFSGDIDTGIYSPGANQFAVTTGGTQRLLIDASGNTTIQGDLTVNGTATTVESNTLSIKDKNIEIAVVSTPTDTTADGGGITVKGASDKTINWVQSTGCWTLNQPTNFNNHVRIDSSGRVGMGTDSPGSYNASADNLVVQNDGGTGSAGITVRAGTGAQSTVYFADGTGASDAIRGYVQYFHNGDFLRFGTDANERLRILSDGKVGVGITSPNRMLVLAQANSTAYSSSDFDQNYHLLKLQNTTDSKTAGLQFLIGSNGEAAITATEVSDGETNLCFGTRGGGSRSEKVRITSAGNVGIGNSAPGAKLQIESTSDQLKLTYPSVASYIHEVDSNGDYSIAKDSSERLRINSSGKVKCLGGAEVVGSGSQALLIGSTDSQSAQLTLDGDSNGDGAGADYASILHSTAGDLELNNRKNQSILFKTGSAEDERLRITSDGKIGVGSSTINFPSGTGLQVYDSSTPRIKLANSTTGTGATDGSYLYVSGSDFIIENKESANMRFYTSATEKMRLDSSGRLLLNGGSDVRMELGTNGTTATNDRNHIRADGDNLKYNTCDSGNHIFEVNGTERMRLDANGNLGVGISNPSDYHANAHRLVVDGGMTLANASTSAIFFADSATGTGEYVGQLNYDHGSNYMQFVVNNGEAMRLDSTRNLTIGPYNTSPYVKGMKLFPDNGGRSTLVLNGTGTDHTALGVYDGNSSSYKLTLKHNGSASFGSPNSGSTSGYGTSISIASNAGDIRAQCTSSASQYTQLFGAYFGTNKTFHVLANGSTEFDGLMTLNAGLVSVGTSSRGARLGNIKVGWDGLYNSVQTDDGTSNLYLQYSSSGGVYIGTNGLVWHSNNDGSGSGLDADLLRGLQPSTGPVANNVMLRDGSKDARARYFIAGTSDANTDGWFRARNDNNSTMTPTGAVVMLNGWYYHQSRGNFQNWLNGAGVTISTNSTSAQIQSGGWFYNTNSGYGLYNVANNTHFYSDSGASWILRSAASSNGIKFDAGGATTRGWVYANTSNEIGFLNNAGSWALRVYSNKNVQTYGDITATGNVTAYSDITLKDDIETIPDALEKVSQIRGVTYNRNDLEDAPRQTGVIAQEVEKVLPEVVSENKDGIKTVAYGNIVGLLIEAIKELKAEVEILKAK